MSDPDPLAEMTDEALVRAAVSHDTYDAPFLERVDAELTIRGLSVDAFADHVYVREPEGESSCSIEESLGILDTMEHWRPVEWTNALGDPITIQVGPRGWLAHRQDASGLVESCQFDEAQIKKTLEDHLKLNTKDWPEGFALDTWPIVDASTSRVFIARVSQELHDNGVEHIVVCPRTNADSEPCDIRTRKDSTLRAEEVLSELYAKIEALQHQAQELADSSDREKELSIYDLLVELSPGKHAVVYNRASVLFELDRIDEAIDGLLEALSLGIPEEHLSDYKGNRVGLFQMVSQTKRGQVYPEYFEDIHAYLLKIEPKHADHPPLLHGLATLARLRNDSAEAFAYYQRVLDVDADDQIARTNVAMLASEEE